MSVGSEGYCWEMSLATRPHGSSSHRVAPSGRVTSGLGLLVGQVQTTSIPIAMVQNSSFEMHCKVEISGGLVGDATITEAHYEDNEVELSVPAPAK